MNAFVDGLFSGKITQKRELVIDLAVTGIAYAKIVEPRTLRKPVLNDWSDALAVVVQFGMSSFDELKSELRSEGYSVQITAAEDQLLERNLQGIYLTQPLLEGYWLNIDYDSDYLTEKLRRLLVIITLGSVFVVAVITFSLIVLIEHYVTQPIVRLERNLELADEVGGLPHPSDAKDEVSSLERTFHGLYNQLKSSYEAIKTLAETDPLTHLLNRRQFNQTLEKILSRIGPDRKLALLYIDLDNFKYVNDNFGHEAGDQLLIEFSERLKHQFRPTDIVLSITNAISRLAGDEFCVLIYDFENDAVIQKAAERIVGMFSEGFQTAIGDFPVSASVGVAVYPRDGTTVQELIVNADASMYQAKSAGKNQFAFYSKELADKNQRFIQIEVALKNVDYSEFSLFYMPQVDSQTGLVTGVEALIRWNSPSLGFVSPAEFIPIAEATGVFRQLDLWVIRKVLSDRAQLLGILGSDARISINISAAQLNSGSFFLDLMLITQQMNQSAKNLVLEITETFAATMSETLSSNLSLLKQAGFELALDDFGTGYSSIVQLLDYPIDEVKIDKYMIDRLGYQKGGMVKAMATFFKSFGYRVTAEGVETQDQVEMLQRMDIDTLQGYFYSKPVPIHQLAKAIKVNKKGPEGPLTLIESN